MGVGDDRHVRVDRRRLLRAIGTGGVAGLAGCASGSDNDATPAETAAETTTRESVAGGTTRTDAAPTETATPETEPADADSFAFVVDPTGSDQNEGSESAPLESVQEAIDRADPGDTIYLAAGVHTSGDPDEPVGITRRAGEPDNPITIAGPREAIVRGPPVEQSTKPLFHITHSHVHLTGMTLNGLTNPDGARDPRWYRQGLVNCAPPTWQESFPDYLSGVKILPRAAGNARAKLISTYRTNHLEIGNFEVIGPAGVDWIYGDKEGYVLGSFVSIGRSPNNFGTAWYPWEDPDQSHDIHIHHIANLDGYAHTELVEPHGGNYGMTIEYCTSLGGGSRFGIAMSGAQSTIRWCRIQDRDGGGIVIRTPPYRENWSEWADTFERLPEDRFPGVNNSVYGNQLLNIAGRSFTIRSPDWFENGPGEQRFLCGNELDEEGDENLDKSCPDSVPEGDGIGHTGGDSPWT